MAEPIKCELCNTVVEPPKKGLLDSQCKCHSVTVLWDVFQNPPVPIHINALDSRSLGVDVTVAAAYQKLRESYAKKAD